MGWIEDTNKDMLKALLSYHVLSANLTLDTLSSGLQKTNNGANISVYKSGTFLTVENAVVVHPDRQLLPRVWRDLRTIWGPFSQKTHLQLPK